LHLPLVFVLVLDLIFLAELSLINVRPKLPGISGTLNIFPELKTAKQNPCKPEK
jgi:hypothetical protein